MLRCIQSAGIVSSRELRVVYLFSGTKGELIQRGKEGTETCESDVISQLNFGCQKFCQEVQEGWVEEAKLMVDR